MRVYCRKAGRPAVVRCRGSRASILGAVLPAVAAMVAAILQPVLDTGPVVTAAVAVRQQPVVKSEVLSDGSSLSDVVSGVYEKNRSTRTWTKKTPAPQSKSGLLNAPPPPEPSSILAALFRAPVAEPPPVPVSKATPVVAYRTMCVRLCDGAYFPVSYSVSRDRFQHDTKVCDTGCGSPAKLYVFEAQGGSVQTMADLDGNPYASLVTAFKFKSVYNPSCTCRAHPWQQEAHDRHQQFARDAALQIGGHEVRAMPKSVVAEADAMASGGAAGEALVDSHDATLANAQHGLVAEAALPAMALSSTSQQEKPATPVVSATIKSEAKRRVALVPAKAAAAKEVKRREGAKRQSANDIFFANLIK